MKRGCRSRVDKPRGWTRAPLRTASTWRTVSPIPFYPRECRPETERACRAIDSRLRRNSFSIGSFSTLSFRDRSSSRRRDLVSALDLSFSSLFLSLSPSREKISAGGARKTPFLSENYKRWIKLAVFFFFLDEESICDSENPSRSRCRCIPEDWTTSKYFDEMIYILGESARKGVNWIDGRMITCGDNNPLIEILKTDTRNVPVRLRKVAPPLHFPYYVTCFKS